ncbi:MAG: ADP-ribosylation factor-like protein [Candidatus Heimdallarchaeota archaeon]
MSYLFDELKGITGEEKEASKVLLMGLQQAGKTAIKDVVFFGKEPGEVEDYMATIHYERQYLDEEKNSLVIDSGGQESYWNEAVTHFRHLVFSNVNLLLWIIDMTRPELFEESERRFSFTIRQYKKENPDGNIVVLCHKVDQIQPEELIGLLDHIKESFYDKKYKIQYEPTSIYYPDSLKELIFKLMEEANMNVKRFELITNLGEKVQDSEEFKNYVMDNREDPRIKQLMDYLHPDPAASLPTFGRVSMQFDLTAYDIIEVVLIDKETFSPVVGTSSKNVVSIDKSMDYIMALQEFKNIIKEKKGEIKSTALIVTSSNQNIHGMIFSLENNFLLITSFSEITEEKTVVLYELIREFAQGIGAPKPAETVMPKITPKLKPQPKVKAPEVKPKPILKAKSPATTKEIKPKEKGPQAPILKEPEEKSRFSFLNQLRDQQVIEIEEEKIAALNKPEKEPEPTPVPAPIPKVVEAVIEPVEEPVEPQPKSSFIRRLKEEGKRYKIRQVQLDKLRQEAGQDKQKIAISKDDMAGLAEYLMQEQDSLPEDVFDKEETEASDEATANK